MMIRMTRVRLRGGLQLCGACAVLFLLSACGTLGPKPWEKDLMARKDMQVGANAAQFAAEDHIYFSKEGASGGRGFAGGGCGCN
jgi:hypothetical protein